MSLIIKGLDMPKGFDTRLRIINDGEKATAYLLDRNYTSPLELGEVIEIPDSVIEIGTKFIMLGDKVNSILEAEG